MHVGCCAPKAIVCWPGIFAIRWVRLISLCGAANCWFLLRSNFAPIMMPVLMPCRPPSGVASARVLPDLSRAIHIMQALSGGLICLLSTARGVSGIRKIFGALEPTRNFGESVVSGAARARRVLIERDAHGLTCRSANGPDCRY